MVVSRPEDPGEMLAMRIESRWLRVLMAKDLIECCQTGRGRDTSVSRFRDPGVFCRIER